MAPEEQRSSSPHLGRYNPEFRVMGVEVSRGIATRAHPETRAILWEADRATREETFDLLWAGESALTLARVVECVGVELDFKPLHLRPDRQRRECMRYALRLPVTFRWVSESGKHQRAHGYSRDVGARGLFVLSGESPPVNAQVECDLAYVDGSGGKRRLVASGRVVRVEAVEPLQQGFALVKDNLIWSETPVRCQPAPRRDLQR